MFANISFVSAVLNLALNGVHVRLLKGVKDVLKQLGRMRDKDRTI